MLGTPAKVVPCMDCKKDTRDRDRPGFFPKYRICGPCIVKEAKEIRREKEITNADS